MKRFLPNLLIFFALSLCALSAFQWVREAHLRADIAKLNDQLFHKSEEIQNLEGMLKTVKTEVTRLDMLKTELTEAVKTNRQEVLRLTKQVEKDESEIERHLKQIDVYKDALNTANANIKTQNENIKKQNEEMKQLAAERNDTVAKYNKMVEQYNDLVKQFAKYQEDVAKVMGQTNKLGQPNKTTAEKPK